MGLLFDDHRDVIRVDRERPVPQVLSRSSVKANSGLVDVFDLAFRGIHADDAREAVEGPALVLDIGVDGTPPDNGT
jgi:hypothetical protein